MIYGLKNLPNEERLRNLRLNKSLSKRRLRGGLINAHKYLIGGSQINGDRLF